MKRIGPDDFQPFFYEQLTRCREGFVVNVFTKGMVDPRLLETLLVLIPKVDQLTHLKEFRPISLLQCSGSRGTMDNVILAQEVLHHINKT
ncbi:hypothetical protein CR513_31146, partial [Mucuna pruriens]